MRLLANWARSTSPTFVTTVCNFKAGYDMVRHCEFYSLGFRMTNIFSFKFSYSMHDQRNENAFRYQRLVSLTGDFTDAGEWITLTSEDTNFNLLLGHARLRMTKKSS